MSPNNCWRDECCSLFNIMQDIGLLRRNGFLFSFIYKQDTLKTLSELNLFFKQIQTDNFLGSLQALLKRRQVDIKILCIFHGFLSEHRVM